MTSVFDCQICGACCLSPWTGEGYVRLYPEDLARLSEDALPVFREESDWDGPEGIVKLGTKRDAGGLRSCAAFEGGAAGPCSCSIYERRPNLCRQFEPGSELCLEARRRVGLTASPDLG